ncbi:hypothetical protein [Streptomyces sp. NPDC058657]|uniref:hypothetical protein n=1 Tax=unclassified Streptomyces TaxID=2593676 RepID=UPI003654B432
MTALTLAPAATDEPNPYFVGRADAYDDTATLTIPQLIVRAGLYADHHPDLGYALGYMDRLLELRRENRAVIAAETELAHTDLVQVTS